jgi:membrane-bound lytic murein transglycosylase B
VSPFAPRLYTAVLLLCAALGARGEAPEGFAACVSGLGEAAAAEGVGSSTRQAAMAATQFVPRVLELDRSQPEFTTPFSRYFGLRVSAGRIAAGQERFRERQSLLSQVYERSGVPGHYLVAFWGLETNFGSYLGKMPLLGSLATLACDPRRPTFFRQQWVAATKLLDRGDLSFDRLEGSWAGALGHVQFMPSVYLSYAQDGDGDGRADLFGSVDDAMVSAGAFLQGLGWARGERWGREVRLPEGFDYGLAGRGQKRPLSFWRAQGVRQADGGALPPGDLTAALLVPSGHAGPAFLVYRNFDVIMGWNRSEFYALSVGILADAIAEGRRLHRPPPAEELRLSMDQVRDLQTALVARGHLEGEVDGLLGPATRAALARAEAEFGLIADGHPDAEAFAALGLTLASPPQA